MFHADIMLQAAHIRSKHGVVLDCSMTATDTSTVSSEVIDALCEKLKGQRYGFLHDLGRDAREPGADIWQWLKQETET